MVKNDLMTTVTDSGKYTFIKQPAGEIEILRYGESWVRIESGCNAVASLMYKVEDQRERLEMVEAYLDESQIREVETRLKYGL